jgi:IclR family acetate operon transcriptional repressor
MQAFADETSESVHLGVLSDDQLLIVASIEGRGLVRLNLQLGATQPPHSTVSGRALLAHLPPTDFEAMTERLEITRAECKQLQKRCAAIRKRGYEHGKSELVEGIEDLGVVVALPQGSALAALTTSWLPRRRTGNTTATKRNAEARTKELLEALRQAAQKIADAYERAD